MSLSMTLSPEFETLDAPVPPAHWGGVFAMSLCVFALIASEFMPVSLLTPMAASLGVTEGQAGYGIAISGAFAVITSLLIPALAARMDPAMSGWTSATSLTARPSPVTMLMTPGGRPAASSSRIV